MEGMTVTTFRLRAMLLVAALMLSGVSIPYAQSRAALAPPFTARVTAVIDGDTIDVVTPDKRIIRIRLEGVDCPEAGQPFSNVARTFTRTLLFDKTVTVRPIDTDRYGRTVARVVVDGKEASIELVSAGFAWVYTTYSADRTLEAAQEEAKRARRGGWVDPNFGPARGTPSRGGRRGAEAGAPPLSALGAPASSAPLRDFHGNRNSRVYHRSTCRNYSCKNCTAVFVTEDDARKAGYKPAGDCLR